MSRKRWKHIDISVIDFNDKKTWELIQNGYTDGVFQLESTGMKDTCRRIKPKSMKELVDILALYRTDTLPALESYIARKNGEEEITYIHEDLIPILEDTYGMVIYQEQVMAISKVFGNYSDGEADKLRKGLGKKDKEIVKEQAEKFRRETIKNGYPEDVANELADYMSKMGGYLFNKGHSAGYAITSYKTAYLKANYPPELMASLISNQRKENGSTDYESVGMYILKSEEVGVKVLNPDINKSQTRFSVGDNNNILFGLSLIKGVGNTAVNEIMNLRPFSDFDDFIKKTEDAGNVNKTVVIALIKSGAFDFTGHKRAELLEQFQEYRFWNKDDSIKPIQNINKNHKAKLIEAKIINANEVSNKELCLKRWNKWRALQHKQEFQDKYMEGNEYNWEYESISYHLKGDPFAEVDLPKWETYSEGYDKTKIGGTIMKIKKVKIKRGKNKGRTMAFLNVDTNEGMRDVTVFNNYWERLQDKLEKGNMVIIRGEKQGDSLLFNGVKALSDFKEDGR